VLEMMMPGADGDDLRDMAAAVRRLRALDCCAVSDALDRLRLAGAVAGIPRRSGRGVLAGRVVTVTLGLPGGAGPSRRHLCTAAIEASGPDDVIVVEQRTGVDAAGWGGILSLAAKLRGVAGVIVDGPARDIDESERLEFSVFARAVTARTARGRIVEVAWGTPISVDGITVETGAYVIADASGVAFVAARNLPEVLEAAEAIAVREAAMAEAVRQGRSVADVMGAGYEAMLREPGNPTTGAAS
jgi:regulator of RNase E activity RraA